MESIINNIINDCSEFLVNSKGQPLYKTFDNFIEPYGKIKVRLKRDKEPDINSSFEKSFKHKKLRQRAIFTTSIPSSIDDFYVFPIDGYKILFSNQIKNSSEDNQKILANLIETMNDIDLAKDTFNDLLSFTYKSDNLFDGIDHGAEIIIYNIPYYYIINSNEVKYDELIKRLINGYI